MRPTAVPLPGVRAAAFTPARFMNPRVLATAILAGAVLVTGAGSARAQSDEGTVTVVHGVPDLTVDVYVNGEPTLEDFAPGTITDPLSLPAGDYELAVRPADADPSSDPAITGSATLPAGANASIVAHLDADGQPTLSVFVNETSTIGAGDARLTVRHTAAAPAVDVIADSSAIVSDLAAGQEATAEVTAGTYEVAVTPAGSSEPVLGPTDLTLEEGTAHFVYAIGSAEDGTLDLLVQTIAGLHSAPGGVPAGTGGLATDTLPWPLAALSVAGLLLALTAGVRLARGRR